MNLVGSRAYNHNHGYQLDSGLIQSLPYANSLHMQRLPEINIGDLLSRIGDHDRLRCQLRAH